MTNIQNLDVSQLVNTIYRRKELVIAIFVTVAIITLYLAFSLPNVYRSSTLILVTPQKLPSNYVNSTITLNMDQRMRAIAQQILSRTSLESIIKELNLFLPTAARTSIEDQIDQLRRQIKIDITRNDTFTLSYESGNPDQAMRVTARLASLFIDENVRVREQQATGTTDFINTEAERLRKELEEQESMVNFYKSQQRNGLPEQLDANLRTLDQLRRELQSDAQRLSAVEERKLALENQLVSGDLLSTLAPVGLNDPAVSVGSQSKGSLEDRRAELASLLRRYSDKHPDVIRLKDEINVLAQEELAYKQGVLGKGASSADGGKRSMKSVLQSQVQNLESEATALKDKLRRLESEISNYQVRVENTPVRAIELAKITRNYDMTLKKFQDLLGKEFDSKLSENMEKRQKGEQFQLVDPASFPEAPIAPNRPRILFVGLLLGLAGGCGTAFLLENLNSSFKKSEDIENFINLPLLAVLPAVPTRGSMLEQRQYRLMVFAASSVMVMAGITFIRFWAHLLPVR